VEISPQPRWTANTPTGRVLSLYTPHLVEDVAAPFQVASLIDTGRCQNASSGASFDGASAHRYCRKRIRRRLRRSVDWWRSCVGSSIQNGHVSWAGNMSSMPSSFPEAQTTFTSAGALCALKWHLIRIYHWPRWLNITSVSWLLTARVCVITAGRNRPCVPAMVSACLLCITTNICPFLRFVARCTHKFTHTFSVNSRRRETGA